MLNNTEKYQNHNIRLGLYGEYFDIESLKKKAELFQNTRILHINSVKRGGGVAAILSHIVPLFNDIGILNHWWVPQIPESNFFQITKRQHNMLQGIDDGILSDTEQSIYWETQKHVAGMVKKHIGEYDFVVIHDTQYLGIVKFLEKRKPKILYRCHIDTSAPNPFIYNFFMPVLRSCDATIYHLPEFVLKGSPDPFFLLPSVDPFDPKNNISAVSRGFIRETIKNLGLDPSRAILLQVGRFDPAKGFEDVCDVFRQLKLEFLDLQLLLTGSGAADDPEFYTYIEVIKNKVRGINDVVVKELPFDVLKLNAVQQAATIVYALSKKEGFGLVVSEASIKKKPVIVTDVGGLPEQVLQGKTGFIVKNVDEAVEKSRFLLSNRQVREAMGERGRKYILSRFITPVHVENYLKIFYHVMER